MTNRTTLVDPRYQYPRPPFKQQPQTMPGVAVEMQPRPDHGESSYQGHGRLKGRKALITGGDSGIGRATAIAYAREGADVAIGYLPSEEKDAQEVIALIKEAGVKGLGLPGDIRDETWNTTMVSKVVEVFGGLDILVINAGRQQFHDSLEQFSTEDFDATLKTNLYGMHWLCQAAAPHLKPGSAIITTSSVQAYDPSDILLDYATTKAGMVAYTKALSKLMIEKGVRVNSVAPGPFWTVLQPSGGQPQEKVEQFGAHSAFGRPGQPVEIAPVYVLLASNEASFITGEVWGVTGGAGIA